MAHVIYGNTKLDGHAISTVSTDRYYLSNPSQFVVWIACPIAFSAASMTASDSVGWTCIVSAISVFDGESELRDEFRGVGADDLRTQ